MSTVRNIVFGAAITAAALSASQASAGELLTNGGFESGDFTGWSANAQSGSNGNLLINLNDGTTATSGHPFVINATGGNYVAITDQSGPGSYSLVQSFTVAADAIDVQVSFQMFANAYGDVANTPPNRDFLVDPNQNALVDILSGIADPFTTTAGDVVATLYGPGADSGPNPNGWTSYSFNLGHLAAGTYQIRFAETDNQGFFNLGVDNVSVVATVGEPAALTLFGASLAGIGMVRRRKRD